MNAVASALPWVALLGFFGLLLKVRVSGDPALWKRIEALEKRLDEERDDCAKRISALEGEIRQLQQQQTSRGRIGEDRPYSGPLSFAFPVDDADQDNDLIAKLDRVPRKRRKRK